LRREPIEPNNDDDEYLDREQGIPHFKGYPGRLMALTAAAGMSDITLDGGHLRG
jgi:acetylene hydratase